MIFLKIWISHPFVKLQFNLKIFVNQTWTEITKIAFQMQLKVCVKKQGVQNFGAKA